MNWRKPLIFAGLYLTGSKIPRYLREIERVAKLPQNEIKGYQDEKLIKLLLHSYQNVPYYHQILPESGVIIDGEVHLENFDKIPILTKAIIRNEGENLYSSDYMKRKPYENSSGGSTGEPAIFIQDKKYDEWNTATKLYFNQMLGKYIGEKELKLWGSERDIISGNIGLKSKIINILYNRSFINSFKLDTVKLADALDTWNTFKPKVVWSYVDSTYEFARYVERKKRDVYPPKAIIVTAGVLTKNVRVYIENVLHTKVYNQYGSREVGVIACECEGQEGLHIFEQSQYLELINPDETGNSKLIVTNLNNYSMPLLRYDIGDTVKLKNANCSCGRSFRMLQNVTGRTTDHFIKKDGTIIHGEYFTHLFYFKKWVKKFQVVQKDYNLIVCRVLLGEDSNREDDMLNIEHDIMLVMGDGCKVEFDFVDVIEPSKSGKYLYTICEVDDDF